MKRALAIAVLVVSITGFGLSQQQPKGLPANGREAVQKKDRYEEWYLQSADKKVFLFIRETGRGIPAVVLHGGPGAGHRYLLDIANGLEDQVRFVFYDQRGAGFTYSAVEDISLDKNVEDLEEIRKALGVDRLNLVSHSAGTMLAMNYLEKYPENVGNLVLLGALDPKNGKRSYFTDSEMEAFKTAGDERDAFYDRPALQAEIKKAGLDKENLGPREQYQLRRIRSAAANIYNIARWRDALFFFINRQAANATQESTDFVYDWSGILSGHKFPVTVINGEYDYVVGPKGSPIWARVSETEARNVELVIVRNAGHSSWIDEPIIFRDRLGKALGIKK